MGWRDNPNFSYRNNNPQQVLGPLSFQKAIQPEPKKSNIELMMENFVLEKTYQNDEFRKQNLLTNETLRKFTIKIDNGVTHIKMLET